jgi:hypothetical protein
MFSHTTRLSLFAVFITFAASQRCYGMDGTQLDDTYAPCNPTAKHSGCCATNKSSGADLCLDNGLCLSTRDELMGTIWQRGCTDASGRDAACPKNLCPDGKYTSSYFTIIAHADTVTNSFGGLNPVPAWNTQQCDYGVYCCRAPSDRRSCCNNSTAPKVTMSSIGLASLPTSTSTSSSSTSDPTNVVATAVSTGSPLSATATPASNNCEIEKKQNAIVGGTIGGLFGAMAVGLAAALFWMHKQELRQRKLKEHYEEQFSQTAAYRRVLASSAASLMGTDTRDELNTKSGGA